MTVRRAILAAIGTVTLLALPLAVLAQQDRMYRVGVVHQGGGSYEQALKGLRDGVKELGFEEGKQFLFHVRDTRGDLKATEEAAQSRGREGRPGRGLLDLNRARGQAGDAERPDRVLRGC